MTRKATDQVTTIGIDIGKNNFHLIGLDDAGNIVLHRKLSRSQVIVRLANGRPGIRSWNLINRMIEN